MTALITFAFKNQTGAQELAAALGEWQKTSQAAVGDAAFVFRRADGGLHAEQINELVGYGQLGGVFWGVFIGLVVWDKFWDLPVGAALNDLGIDDDYVKDIGDALGMGHSVLFTLLDDELVALVTAEGENLGAKALPFPLDDEVTSRLYEVFGRSEGK